MGITDDQHDRGRQSVFFHPGSRQMGRRLVHRCPIEALDPGADVDGGEAERWQAEFRPLRLRMVHRIQRRSSRGGT